MVHEAQSDPAPELGGSGRVETVSIVIPTFRRPEALTRTLESIMAIEYPAAALEVVVVDDGADASTERVVTARSEGDVRVRYVSQPRGGAAKARNHGARLAGGDLLVFCDDDVIVERDHLHRHLAAQDCHGDALVNGVSDLATHVRTSFSMTSFGRLRLELERGYEAEADGPLIGDGRFEALSLSARNLAVPRKLFWQLGGFDEAFPYAGAEDQDLTIRARRTGSLLLRDHAIRVSHNEQTRTLAQFCAREERGGQTIVVLARRFPAEIAQRRLLIENGPLARADGRRLVLKKLAKILLSREASLVVVHRAVQALERVALDDVNRHRLYQGVIGLHIFRGVRTGLRQQL